METNQESDVLVSWSPRMNLEDRREQRTSRLLLGRDAKKKRKGKEERKKRKKFSVLRSESDIVLNIGEV